MFKHELDERFEGTSKMAACGNVLYPLAKSHDEGELGHAWEAMQEIAIDRYAKGTGMDANEAARN